MFIKKFVYLSLILITSTVLFACSQSDKSNSNQNIAISTTTPPTTFQTPSPKADQIMAINTSKGQILIQLNTALAPQTASLFLAKADNGFYNNLIFHRVEPGFVIQGGDPTGTGHGGGSIKSELNNQPFVRGSVGLARTPETPEISNDSQFFICLTTENCSALTGQYVNFAQVVSGMEVVDSISRGDKIINITSKTK